MDVTKPNYGIDWKNIEPTTKDEEKGKIPPPDYKIKTPSGFTIYLNVTGYVKPYIIDYNCHQYVLGGADVTPPLMIFGNEMTRYLKESKEWTKVEEVRPGDILVIKAGPEGGVIKNPKTKVKSNYDPWEAAHSGIIRTWDPANPDLTIIDQKERPGGEPWLRDVT